MKPSTPQQFANCYGVFIADLVKVGAYASPGVWTWLRTSLPDVESAYKLNPTLFTAYTASITSIPFPKGGPRAYTSSQAKKINDEVNRAWTSVTIDLKNALTCAGVDPKEVVKILASFKKLKPKEIKGFDGKS